MEHTFKVNIPPSPFNLLSFPDVALGSPAPTPTHRYPFSLDILSPTGLGSHPSRPFTTSGFTGTTPLPSPFSLPGAYATPSSQGNALLSTLLVNQYSENNINPTTTTAANTAISATSSNLPFDFKPATTTSISTSIAFSHSQLTNTALPFPSPSILVNNDISKPPLTIPPLLAIPGPEQNREIHSSFSVNGDLQDHLSEQATTPVWKPMLSPQSPWKPLNGQLLSTQVQQMHANGQLSLPSSYPPGVVLKSPPPQSATTQWTVPQTHQTLWPSPLHHQQQQHQQPEQQYIKPWNVSDMVSQHQQNQWHEKQNKKQDKAQKIVQKWNIDINLAQQLGPQITTQSQLSSSTARSPLAASSSLGPSPYTRLTPMMQSTTLSSLPASPRNVTPSTMPPIPSIATAIPHKTTFSEAAKPTEQSRSRKISSSMFDLPSPKSVKLMDHQIEEMSPPSRGHVCQICQKPFPSISKLERHQTVHTGARNFHCEFCPGKYTQKSTLDTHMKKHKSLLEKPEQ